MAFSGHPFLSANRAKEYESWYRGAGRRADRLEKRLLRWCLGAFPDARTILEVGCGTGHFSRWFAESGLEVTGLDNSPAMLEEARARGGVSYVESDALALGASSHSVDLVALITTLEFLGDPVRAVVEAMRVARHGLILGVLNRTSLLGRRRRRAGGAVWGAARFFSPAEVMGIVQQAGEERVRAVQWRTTLWPIPLIGGLSLPWGGLIAVSYTHLRAHET